MSLPKITIGIHDGLFHADEVFAIAALSFIYDIDLARTRDLERLAKVDMRVDVGNKYNHETKDYDHHMAGFNVRHPSPDKYRFDEGPLRSGFGLIYLHYGKEIIAAILSTVLPDATPDADEIEEIWTYIDRGLVAMIDCIDNGEGDRYLMNKSPYGNNNITRFISLLNPDSSDQSPDTQMVQFYKAVEFAKIYLTREVRSVAERILARKVFHAALEDLQGEILIFDKYVPWQYAYARAGDLTNPVQMVVFPSMSGAWMCQTPKYYYGRDKYTFPATMKDGSRRIYLHQAPKDICGLKDEELEKKTGIKDVTFVHSSGHLGGAKTKEACIELATYFIDNGRT